MNLLELMLHEEVEWPVGAEFAAQDRDTELWWFKSKIPRLTHGESMWYGCDSDARFLGDGMSLLASADDWSTRIITREEYQAAGGWMKYSGSGVPVIESDLCEAILENEGSTYNAEFTGWNLAEWEGKDGVIKKYRVIKRDTDSLDHPKSESGFESFVSVEDAHECKAENAATSKQSAPKGSGNPILGMVLADLTNRALEGKEKYGEPLKAHNGRNALWDAYQEALDLAMYLRQLIEEQGK